MTTTGRGEHDTEPLRADVIRAWRLSIEAATEAGTVRLGEFNWPWALGLALDALESARADNERLRGDRANLTKSADEIHRLLAALVAAQPPGKKE